MMTFDILFSGDYAPVGRYEGLIKKSSAGIFGNLLDDIRGADVSLLNLESPVCSKGTPIKKTGPSLRISPECLKVAKGAGFGLVGLANNHIMDYGSTGLADTIKICNENNLQVVGAGRNLEEAQKHLIVEEKGLKLAFIAVTEHEFSIAEKNKPGAAPLDVIDNYWQIQKAKKEADFVFVQVHGGNELFNQPRPGLRKYCKFYIDSGADAVLCHHSHVPGSYEFYNSKPIVYGMGNLIFDHINPPEGWCTGYAVKLRYDVSTKVMVDYKLIPYIQSVEKDGLIKMKGEKYKCFFDTMTRLNETLADDQKYIEVWYSFCKKMENRILPGMFIPIYFPGINRLFKIPHIARMLMPKSTLLKKMNMIRCESYHELLLGILEKK